MSMLEKVRSADGFIAALDQSGGSTPKALSLYGIDESEYEVNTVSMFDCIHKMRTRIMTSPAFGGDRILGAILFQDTLNREVDGKPTAKYLWEEKNIVPFLKVDKGLATEENGVQVMKPIPDLEEVCGAAFSNGVFGTKMRSNINSANAEGIKAVVSQQFEVGKVIISKGLVPIIEPEVNINAKDKAECEVLLKQEILANLDMLSESQNVMLKLTLPSSDNFYKACCDHPRVVRVVALSGGYSRDVANEILARNSGVVASFSRALTEGLSAKMTEDEYNKSLGESIQSIYDASNC